MSIWGYILRYLSRSKQTLQKTLHRKRDFVLEGLQNKIPFAELCNWPQITQSLYYYWLNKFQAKSHEVFNAIKKSKKERRLVEEYKEHKRIIANLTIELRKSELELEGEDL